MHIRVFLGALALFLLVPALTRADAVYNLTVNENGVSSENVTVGFTVPSILTSTTTGITPTSSSLGSAFPFCNVTSVSVNGPSQLTDIEIDILFGGVGCLFAGATADFNMPLTSDGVYIAYNNFTFSENIGTLTISTPTANAPEPSSLALLGFGLLGLVGLASRQRVSLFFR